VTIATEALRDVWCLAGGDPAALERVSLTGSDPVLPSSFGVGTAAQVSIAAAALAAAELSRLRTGREQSVAVDMRHAAVEFRSERHLRIVGTPPPALWNRLAGVYRTGDARFVRLHTNFRHHRQAVTAILRCGSTREEIQAALLRCEGETFETAAHAAGGVVAMMRSAAEWAAHPQAQALTKLPLLEIEKIGDAEPRALGPTARPLTGLRVLDLTRIIAGPVCGRTLAAHGADVMRIASPGLPFLEWLVIDTGRGKLSAHADVASPEGRAALTALLRQADVFIQAYRPGAIAARGFSAEDAARLRPGIVYGTLSAYGRDGPWSSRRGFDSLVQTATGFNHAEGLAAGVDGPKELPAQVLDHASGQLMAFGVLMARARQTREGGSWHVRVSLAQTGRWLWDLGRVEGGLTAPDLRQEDVEDLLEESESGFGRLRAVRHAGALSETPAHWERPAVPLGTHEPRWLA
jgi:crotonobetainyl-CoA:carnitine CoA-transferase CaiB-like acyl-CoA transferase